MTPQQPYSARQGYPGRPLSLRPEVIAQMEKDPQIIRAAHQLWLRKEIGNIDRRLENYFNAPLLDVS